MRYTLAMVLFFCMPPILFAQQPAVYKDTLASGFFKRTSGVVAMDGCYSLRLADGKTMWLFGDSYIDEYNAAAGTVPCLFQARNSALLQPATHSWQPGKTRTLFSLHNEGKTYLQDTVQPSNFIWPSPGYQLIDTIYVFGLNMKNSSGGLGFAKAGDDVWIKIKYPEMQPVGFSYVAGLDSIQFGIGLIPDTVNGYAYMYGNKLKGLSGDIYVARFDLKAPAAAWLFWNGSSWTKDIRAIQPIATAPSNSNNICRINNTYIMFTTEFSIQCNNGKHIYASVSNSPTGPFSPPKAIYTITDTVQGHYPFFYLPIAHPEFINDKNELLVTYCINGYEPCLANCVNNAFNAAWYRPQAIRVPLVTLMAP